MPWQRPPTPPSALPLCFAGLGVQLLVLLCGQMELQQHSLHVRPPEDLLLLPERGAHPAGGLSLPGRGQRQICRSKAQKINARGPWAQWANHNESHAVFRITQTWYICIHKTVKWMKPPHTQKQEGNAVLEPSRQILCVWRIQFGINCNIWRFPCGLLNCYFLVASPRIILPLSTQKKKKKRWINLRSFYWEKMKLQ